MAAEGVPRVFVSYTGQDLSAHAAVVRDVVQQREWIAVDHAQWSASGRPSVPSCVEQVCRCDLLIVLVAHRYGWVPPADQDGDGERSIVRIEVEAAQARDMPVLPFLVDDDASWKLKHVERLEDPQAGERLEAFKAQLREGLCARFGEPPESLRSAVQQALEQAEKQGRIERAHPAPPRPPAEPAESAPLLDAYFSWLRERYGEVRLLGFGEQFEATLPIDQLYVPLRAMTARSLQGDTALGKHDPERLERSDYVERDVLVTDALRHAGEFGLQGVALVGDPGAGKTTAARRLCWQAATPEGARQLGLDGATIPVLIRLRRLRPGDEKRSLRDFVRREVRSWCGTEDGQLDEDGKALAASLWKHPRVLWLFDGLDEVSDEGARAKVSSWIRAHRSRHHDHRYVVTCRYAGYQADAKLGAKFLDMHVQSLARPQQDEFVKRWYGTVEAAVGGPSPQAATRAAERGDALCAILGGRRFVNQRLASMAANPLLLSVLCLVHRKGDTLPRRRGRLYDQCVSVLLEHWRGEWRAAQDVEPIDQDSARALLAPMAWWLHQEKGRTDGEGVDIMAALEQTLATLSDRPDLADDGLRFLERIRDDAGLLVTPDPGRFGFLHLTFQEYLAAQHAVQQGLTTELAEHIEDEWWKEVTLLAVGQAPVAFTEAYFRHVLGRDSLAGLEEPLQDILEEALHVPVPTLVAGLVDRSADDQVVLLSRLQGRREDALLEAARSLSPSGDDRVVSLAEQILVQAGAPVPARPKRDHLASRREGIATSIEERTGIVFVTLDGGTFAMGGTAYADEQPIHNVTVQAFELAGHPVTNEQFRRFLENSGHRRPAFWTDSQCNQPRQPVVGVSWEDAWAFCNWYGLRLPSEAEWEYACRAGTTSEYSFGDDEVSLTDYGWFGNNSGNQSRPVGEKLPNPWGLHDMHGNVWEWCEDIWHVSHEGAPDDGSPRVDTGSDIRVVRGGSWTGTARYCRSAGRYWDRQGSRDPDLGFRPARSLA